MGSCANGSNVGLMNKVWISPRIIPRAVGLCANKYRTFSSRVPTKFSVPTHDTAVVYRSESTDPYINLAFEEWIFNLKERPDNVLFLWRNTPCVVIGRNQNVFLESNMPGAEADGVPIIRRKSGGGAVYHDLGNSVYTVMTPKTNFHRDNAAKLICKALGTVDIKAGISERHDIIVNGFKVSGSAYKLTNHKAYHHGTMLIDSDLNHLGRYLRSPFRDSITAKGVSSVRSKVTKLTEYSNTITHDLFCDAVERQYKLSLLDVDDTEAGINDPELSSSNALAGPVLKYIDTQIKTLHVTELEALTIPEVKAAVDELKSKKWLYEQQPAYSQKFEFCTPKYKFELDIATNQGKTTSIGLSGFRMIDSSIIDKEILDKINLNAGIHILGKTYSPKLIFDAYSIVRRGKEFPTDPEFKEEYEVFLQELLNHTW